MKILYALLLLLFSTLLSAQDVNKDERKFLRKNSSRIVEGKNFSQADWAGFRKHVKHKRYVFLGEFNHGSREVFTLRNSLIQDLHQHLGFDVILFETGMGELIPANFERDSLSPQHMMRGLMGPWHTTAFADLMGYIKTNHIEFAGFDVQRSNGAYARGLKAYAADKGIDTSLYLQLENRYSTIAQQLRKRPPYDSVSVATQNLIDAYKHLHDVLVKMPQNTRKDSLLVHTLVNRQQYLSYMLAFLKDKDWRKRWAARDQAMADNIIWLAEHVFKGKKMVIIAHNFHISKFSEKELAMGEVLAPYFGDKMYSLGVFAEKGLAAGNYRNEKPLSPPSNQGLDIKHIIQQLSGFAHFLPIPTLAQKGNEWLFQPITVNDTFIDLNNSHEMVLSQHFDGLLLIKEVGLPEYVK